MTKQNNISLTPKKKRGRPPLTEAQKSEALARRESIKTRKFAVGSEPNRRRNHT